MKKASEKPTAQRIIPSNLQPVEDDKIRILIIEDEPTIHEGIEYSLQAEGFDTYVAEDGKKGIEEFQRIQPHLVLLDLMLPNIPGTEVCKELRANSKTPIIMLTAKGSEIDKVVGLELGADDYITKPFSMREMIARIRAVLRRMDNRSEVDDSQPVDLHGIYMDPERHEVKLNGEPIELPPKEFALLHLLIKNAGRVLTRDTIIEQIWGKDYVGDTKTLDVHIKRLRGRIESDQHNPRLILTIRSVGYKFSD